MKVLLYWLVPKLPHYNGMCDLSRPPWTTSEDMLPVSSVVLGLRVQKILPGKAGTLAKRKGQGPVCKEKLFVPSVLVATFPVSKQICFRKWILWWLKGSSVGVHWLGPWNGPSERDPDQRAALNCPVDWQGRRCGVRPLLNPLVNYSVTRTLGTKFLPTPTWPKVSSHSALAVPCAGPPLSSDYFYPDHYAR